MVWMELTMVLGRSEHQRLAAKTPSSNTLEGIRVNSRVPTHLVGFLDATDFSGLSTEDIAFIEIKGGFTLPSQVVRDELYLPHEFLKAAGFDNIQRASKVMLKRAKVLLDFNVERNDLIRSQGALLLTYYTSVEDPLCASSFLANSIQAAVAAGAHTFDKGEDKLLQVVKKRLWWSIFVRDRILALGLRRPPQILPTNFGSPSTFIVESDIQNKSLHSEVYDTDSKNAMVKLWRSQCHLALILTEVVLIACPPGGLSQICSSTGKDFQNAMARINHIKNSLNNWYTSTRPLMESWVKHNSPPTLFKDMILLHYYAAKLAICDFAIFTAEGYADSVKQSQRGWLESSKNDIRKSIYEMLEIAKNFVLTGQVAVLPAVIAPYLSLPFILGTLELGAPESSLDVDSHKVRLYFLLEILRGLGSRYEIVKHYVLMIQKILGSLKLREMATVPELSLIRPDALDTDLMSLNDISRYSILDSDLLVQAGSQRNWWNILTDHPRIYLRCSVHLSYIVGRGHFPNYDELPSLARDLYPGDSKLMDGFSQSSGCGCLKTQRGMHGAMGANKEDDYRSDSVIQGYNTLTDYALNQTSGMDEPDFATWGVSSFGGPSDSDMPNDFLGVGTAYEETVGTQDFDSTAPCAPHNGSVCLSMFDATLNQY
ncbi:hypothetical protein BJY01DRAFT_245326 [Aspergillus pseudoustus]|uniref:Xylanolytic transcriptional activator regulatory domain-containing protein n=1 Tax=Aspergillus pseudoustus TaxID=1810923 RepID=A0ABR4KEC5_9EURO